MELINNHVAVKTDTHFDWIRDSQGNPFLQRVTKFDAYKNSITSGTITHVCQSLTPNYKYGTQVELQEGDKVIFNYMAIKRDRDGINITHDKKIGESYVIKYEECYARIRGEEITPINGWVFLEMEDIEIQSKIFLPDYLKKKKSSSIGVIKYLGTPLKYYREWIDEGADSDDWCLGQRVIIPTWKAIPLQRPEHAIAKEKTLVRVQRKDLTDYNWVEQSVKEWTSRPDYVEPKKDEPVRLTPEELKPYLIGGNPKNDHNHAITHGLKRRNQRDKIILERREQERNDYLNN